MFIINYNFFLTLDQIEISMFYIRVGKIQDLSLFLILYLIYFYVAMMLRPKQLVYNVPEMHPSVNKCRELTFQEVTMP